MVLQSRGCPLKGLPSTPTLEAHRQRFLTNGWEKAHAVDLDTIYKQHIDPQDKCRCCTWLLAFTAQLPVFLQLDPWSAEGGWGRGAGARFPLQKWRIC